MSSGRLPGTADSLELKMRRLQSDMAIAFQVNRGSPVGMICDKSLSRCSEKCCTSSSSHTSSGRESSPDFCSPELLYGNPRYWCRPKILKASHTGQATELRLVACIP